MCDAVGECGCGVFDEVEGVVAEDVGECVVDGRGVVVEHVGGGFGHSSGDAVGVEGLEES